MAHRSGPDDPDNVVALSRFRAQLSRGSRARRTDDLFAAGDPDKAIKALPPDEFFYVISELGFPDALEVLAHGTADQVQVALDFAVWDRDQISLERTDEWLGALVEAEPDTVARWVKGLDIELLALLLRKRARIYDLSLEEPPDEAEGMLWPTPDRLFVVELLGDDEQSRVTGRLLECLYRSDQNYVRRVLVGARAELDAELEELAYRWRSGRMADLGFIDFYEALEVYQELDPAVVRLGDEPAPPVRPRGETETETATDSLRLPRALAARLRGKAPFARGMAGVSNPDELAELHFALVALSNHVLSADRVIPGDEQAVTAVLERLAATLDLAVEFLGRGSEELVVKAVRNVPLTQLFRVGVSLVGKLRRLGVALQKETPFAKLPRAFHLFELEDTEVLTAVTRLRPMFPRRLETPPASGERPFAQLADVALVTAALERAGAVVALLHGLGVRPEPIADLDDPALVDAGVLARTILVARLSGDPAGPLRPLTTAVVEKFKKRFKDREQARAAVREVLPTAPGSAAEAVADRWSDSLVPLEPVLMAKSGRRR